MSFRNVKQLLDMGIEEYLKTELQKPRIPRGIYWYPYPISYYSFARGIPPSFYKLPSYIEDQQFWFYAHPEDYIARKPTIMVPEYESKRAESTEYLGRHLQPGEIPPPLIKPDNPFYELVPDRRPWAVYAVSGA